MSENNSVKARIAILESKFGDKKFCNFSENLEQGFIIILFILLSGIFN